MVTSISMTSNVRFMTRLSGCDAFMIRFGETRSRRQSYNSGTRGNWVSLGTENDGERTWLTTGNKAVFGSSTVLRAWLEKCDSTRIELLSRAVEFEQKIERVC